MSTLPALRKTFYRFGRNHVQFNGTDCVKTTSNFITRWFNRVCAYFSDSEKKKNQDVCTAFLEIIKKDSVYGCMHDDAQKIMNDEGRIGTGKPLSGHKAMKVLDSLFREAWERRAEEIRRCKETILDSGNEFFVMNIIEKQPKLVNELPVMVRYLNIYAGKSVAGKEPTEEERCNAKKYIETSVMERFGAILLKQSPHRTQAFSSDEICSAITSALIEKELKHAYFDPSYAGIIRRGPFASLVKQCNVNGRSAPTISDYKQEVDKAIMLAATNWESCPELMAMARPDTFNQNYIRRLPVEKYELDSNELLSDTQSLSDQSSDDLVFHDFVM